jgi:hypothetical protein
MLCTLGPLPRPLAPAGPVANQVETVLREAVRAASCCCQVGPEGGCICCIHVPASRTVRLTAPASSLRHASSHSKHLKSTKWSWLV